MARMYVPSTPYTRGERELPADGASDEPRELSREELEAAAKALGLELTVAEPAGNASLEDWVNYARAKGATDEDLVDADGKPLKRDEVKAKFGKTVEVTGD